MEKVNTYRLICGDFDPNSPKPSELLKSALALFGPDGERWIKGSMKVTKRPWWGLGLVANQSYCSVGAIAEVNTSNQIMAQRYLSREVYEKYGCGVIHFNDWVADGFSDVKEMFTAAIAAAQADGR